MNNKFVDIIQYQADSKIKVNKYEDFVNASDYQIDIKQQKQSTMIEEIIQPIEKSILDLEIQKQTQTQLQVEENYLQKQTGRIFAYFEQVQKTHFVGTGTFLFKEQTSNRSVVLTSAHIVYQIKLQKVKNSVFANSVWFLLGDKSYSIQEIKIYPKYMKDNDIQNDLALLFISPMLNISNELSKFHFYLQTEGNSECLFEDYGYSEKQDLNKIQIINQEQNQTNIGQSVQLSVNNLDSIKNIEIAKSQNSIKNLENQQLQNSIKIAQQDILNSQEKNQQIIENQNQNVQNKQGIFANIFDRKPSIQDKKPEFRTFTDKYQMRGYNTVSSSKWTEVFQNNIQLYNLKIKNQNLLYFIKDNDQSLGMDGSLIYKYDLQKKSLALVGIQTLQIKKQIIGVSFDRDMWQWIQSFLTDATKISFKLVINFFNHDDNKFRVFTQKFKKIQLGENFYEGNVVNGKLCGKGITKYQNGDVYEGNYLKDQRSGHGLMKYSIGDTYNGEWKEDQYYGFGVYSFILKGEKCQGFWTKNKIQQDGEYFFSNGDKYTGQIVNGFCEGTGVIMKQNGDKYEGQMRLNNMHGKGRYFFKDGKCFIGIFENNIQVSGEYLNIEGQEDSQFLIYYQEPLQFKRDIQELLQEPQKEIQYPSYEFQSTNSIKSIEIDQNLNDYFSQISINPPELVKFSGQQANNVKNGTGIAEYSNGDIYQGNFVQNKKQGQGKYIFKEGPLKSFEGVYDEENQNTNGTLKYKSGEKYIGQMVGYRKNGLGKLYYNDGSYFDGQFKNDEKVNKGKIVFVDGSNYEGKCAIQIFKGEFTGNQISGKGIFIYFNKDRYEGSFRYSKRDGIGRYIFAEDSFFECQWLEDNPDKFGDFCSYPNVNLQTNRIMTSDVKQQMKMLHDLRLGKNKLEFLNKDSYEGELHNGKLHGYGLYKFYNDSGQYVGSFVDNHRQGKGVFCYKNGDIYDGDWMFNKRHGKGILTYSCGQKYEGEFQYGKKQGFGKYTYENGQVYEGQFFKGSRSGLGKMTFVNGDLYEGNWSLDKINGKGKYTKVDGQVLEGTWIDGVLQPKSIFDFLEDYFVSNYT